MLADVSTSRLSEDMKIAVQKNHLGGLIFYRSLDHSKKRRDKNILNAFFLQVERAF